MVAEKGHEIGLHGYSHENPIAMTLEQQTVVMDKVWSRLVNPLADSVADMNSAIA
jgi:peptidoglycan/xylan/chitin deacetylase (PgdA/CDA1 family)